MDWDVDITRWPTYICCGYACVLKHGDDDGTGCVVPSFKASDDFDQINIEDCPEDEIVYPDMGTPEPDMEMPVADMDMPAPDMDVPDPDIGVDPTDGGMPVDAEMRQ